MVIHIIGVESCKQYFGKDNYSYFIQEYFDIIYSVYSGNES